MTIVTDASGVPDDPYLWLEEIDGAQALAWAGHAPPRPRLRFATRSSSGIGLPCWTSSTRPTAFPGSVSAGRYVYNFWQDEQHPKGLWRRTTMARYRSDDPQWDVLLDVDALAKAEGEDWVWRGCVSLPPEHRLGLIQLSRGGADATVIREFDLAAKRFVDGGFLHSRDQGRRRSGSTPIRCWLNVALGGERFETTSGYARTVRRWRRGTPLEAAPVVFECERTDMAASGWREHSPRKPRTFFIRQTDFFHSTLYVENDSGTLQPFDIPSDAVSHVEHDWLILYLRSDWVLGGRTYPAGALLVIGIDAALAGSRDFAVLFEPTPPVSLQSFQAAGNVVGIKVLDNVRSRVWFARFSDGAWRSEAVSGFPELGDGRFRPPV